MSCLIEGNKIKMIPCVISKPRMKIYEPLIVTGVL